MVSTRWLLLNWLEKRLLWIFSRNAVHNGDPMTDNDYDGGMAVGGYPSGYVNRGTEVDPSDFELEFIKNYKSNFSYIQRYVVVYQEIKLM